MERAGEPVSRPLLFQPLACTEHAPPVDGRSQRAAQTLASGTKGCAVIRISAGARRTILVIGGGGRLESSVRYSRPSGNRESRLGDPVRLPRLVLDREIAWLHVLWGGGEKCRDRGLPPIVQMFHVKATVSRQNIRRRTAERRQPHHRPRGPRRVVRAIGQRAVGSLTTAVVAVIAAAICPTFRIVSSAHPCGSAGAHADRLPESRPTNARPWGRNSYALQGSGWVGDGSRQRHRREGRPRHGARGRGGGGGGPQRRRRRAG